MPKESSLHRRIKKALKKKYGSHLKVIKIHGGPMMEAGLPDLIICCHGLFIGLEVKVPDGHIEDLQIVQRDEFRKAGAICEIVTSVDQALEAVANALRRAKVRCNICPPA